MSDGIIYDLAGNRLGHSADVIGEFVKQCEAVRDDEGDVHVLVPTSPLMPSAFVERLHKAGIEVIADPKMPPGRAEIIAGRWTP